MYVANGNVDGQAGPGRAGARCGCRRLVIDKKPISSVHARARDSRALLFPLPSSVHVLPREGSSGVIVIVASFYCIRSCGRSMGRPNDDDYDDDDDANEAY